MYVQQYMKSKNTCKLSYNQGWNKMDFPVPLRGCLLIQHFLHHGNTILMNVERTFGTTNTILDYFASHDE